MAPSAVFSIDDTTGEAKWAWDDDHDDTDAAAPLDASGAPVTVTPSSDNDAVATIGAPDQATKSAPVTPVAEGSFNLVVAVTDSAGAPAVWPADAPGGVAGQPITVAPISGSVGPGPAGGLAATLNP